MLRVFFRQCTWQAWSYFTTYRRLAREPGGSLVTLIKTVDVSSHQTPSLTSLAQWVAQGCQLLWVHSYHSGEKAGLEATTRAWIGVARQAEVWCLPYVWLFRSLDPARQTREAIELFRESDMPPKLIALDCETYGVAGTFDPGPTAEQILTAAETAREMGVEVVLYSGNWWLVDMQGNPEILRGVPAWIANYSIPPTLNVPAPDWVNVIGHQYTSTPVDWSVFDLEALQSLSAPADPCQVLRDALRADIATMEELVAGFNVSIERLKTLAG
jgi:GH25 family lysozyme M1 (1,4-beta-N-acetylmuramidase)